MGIEWIIALVIVAGVVGYGISVLIKNKTIKGLNEDIEKHLYEHSEITDKLEVVESSLRTADNTIDEKAQELKDKCSELLSLEAKIKIIATDKRKVDIKLVAVNKELKASMLEVSKLAEDINIANKASLKVGKENVTLRKEKKTLETKVMKLEDKPTGKAIEKKATKPASGKKDVKQPNTRKLNCPKIKAARARAVKGEDVSDLAKELNVSTSTLKRAIDGATYKDCAEKAKETKPTPKPSEKKDAKPVVKKTVKKVTRKRNTTSNKKGKK